MIRRSTVVYIVLLLLLVGAYYYLNNREQPAGIELTLEPGTEVSQEFLFPSDEGAPTSIRIETKTGETVEVVRGEDNTWAMTQPGMADDLSTLRALQLLSFATGGVGHVVGLGLLLAGVSTPAAFARLLPRWIVWLGLALAVLAELSSVSLVFPMAALLLPLSRFPSLVWLIAAGFAMPSSRPAGGAGQAAATLR